MNFIKRREDSKLLSL